MRFEPFASDQSFADTEVSVLEYWKREQVFEASVEARHPKNTFRFFDGPPFATGLPHYGHILAGTIKDAVPRYQTMKGYRVPRRFGWDCHGLPVEYQVEKEHGIGGRPGIEAMGVGNFNELCRSIVLRCRDDWENTVDRMGRFVDFKHDYKTMDADFMESVWWVFSQLHKKGLIYEGEKVVPYSPKLGSPLSNFEANLNYKDIDDPAVTVAFKLLGDRHPNTYALAWTTTPWTLPANVGLGFGRDTEYVKVSLPCHDHVMTKYVIIAKAVYDREKAAWEEKGASYKGLFHEYVAPGEHAPEVGEVILGKDMAGMAYEPLFPFFDNLPKETSGQSEEVHSDSSQTPPKRFITVHDEGDYVSTDEGTGIVHFAPTFGAEDAEICDKWGLYGVDPIDGNGYFTDAAPPLAGTYFREDPEVPGSKEDNANTWVMNALKERGQLFRREQIRHSYPHCWRTDCALQYRAIKTWFVDIQTLKDQMLAQNENIHWMPEHLKYGRFGKGLESAPDWAISRNRYWGTPMPVWKCDKTGAVQVVSSREDLERLSGVSLDDLHRHFVDDLTWENPETGGTMRRIPEVLDCWFESGSMPYASVHFPFEGEDMKADFPAANFIAEGLDQTRCWFYALHVLGVALFGKNIFENVITNGIVLAEDGQKMSKSKKNYPDPNLIFEKYGADAMRFYLLSSPVVKGENLRFSEAGVEEVLKSVLLPLRNAYNFFATYADIDGWSPTRFFFQRHGEALHNTLGVYSCRIENPHPLTPEGREQIAAQAKALPRFDALYASPLVRTQETAQLLRDGQNFAGEIVTDNRLIEVDCGTLEGHALVGVEERMRREDTEDLPDLQGRIAQFMQEVARTHAGKNIAVATHGECCRAAVSVGSHIPARLDDWKLLPIPRPGQHMSVYPTPQPSGELDRWILSRLHSCLRAYRAAMDTYDLELALREVPALLDDLTNWYIRRSRRRFWGDGLTQDKRDGYETLHCVLRHMALMLAPVCPFFADELHRRLGGTPSVHLGFMPQVDENLIDPALERKIRLTRDIVRLSAGIRARKKIKLRQPLQKLQLVAKDAQNLDLADIAEEANVKEISILENPEGLAQKIIRVDAKKVGKKLGAKVQEVIRAGKEGHFTQNADGGVMILGEVLAPDEYEVSYLCAEGLDADASHEVLVLLETDITPELAQECLAREVIRTVQQMRKDRGLAVSDRIHVKYRTDDATLTEALATFGEKIATEVLATTFEANASLTGEVIQIEDASIIIDIQII